MEVRTVKARCLRSFGPVSVGRVATESRRSAAVGAFVARRGGWGRGGVGRPGTRRRRVDWAAGAEHDDARLGVGQAGELGAMSGAVGGQFGLGLVGVHRRHPIGRARHGPRGEQPAVFGRTAQPAIQAAPPPLLRPANQVGSSGLAFGITGHPKQVIVVLKGKRLETSLIDVAGARR